MNSVGQEDHCNRVEFLDDPMFWKGENERFLNGRCVAWTLIGGIGNDVLYAEILR